MTILPLEAEAITLTAGDRALLDAISLRIEEGPPSIILGPNGAGKSLLLRVCHGLLPPDRGSIRWSGPGGPEARRKQAMIFQNPVMLRRSVWANVAYGLKLRRQKRDRVAGRTAEALELTGLAGFASQAAVTLSLGEQQRLALARAWALEPDVLFMDEPTASLDPSATGTVEELIRAVSARGTKIVMSTHDLAQARRLAGEVLFLHTGRLVEQAPADQFFAAPATDAARAFLEGRLLW